MIKYIKYFLWSFRNPIGRFNYINGMLSIVPGRLGLELRNNIIPSYFKTCGKNISIQNGVRFLNVHKLEAGDSVVMAEGSFLNAGGGITLGNNVLLGPDVKIWSQNHVISDTEKPIIEQGWEYEPVIIEDNVWLAANVVILPGVRLPQGCVVSAGAVVGKKQYPPYSIIAGNPARAIGKRK